MTPKNSTLHAVVDDLIQQAAPVAIHNHNYIINNIPADIRIEGGSKIVESVLNKLFTTTLWHTKNSVILITAKVYGMVVLVQLKSKGTVNPALPEDMGQACLNAQKTGGIIEVIHCENDQASIAYCFLNVAEAA